MAAGNRHNFNLIKGGLNESAGSGVHEFAGAAVTNTRLMGVISMTVHWYLPENSQMTDLYQFFYFDAEENGFETYSSLLGGNSPVDYRRVVKAEKSWPGDWAASRFPSLKRKPATSCRATPLSTGSARFPCQKGRRNTASCSRRP